MFETNAMVLPSGDQVVAPTDRVMYSRSMERLCWFCSTFALGLLVICLGSVIAWGAGRVCGRVRVLIEMTMANKVNERIGDTKSVAEAFVILSAATSSHGEEVAESKEALLPFWNASVF